ncbi:MAG: hypothetical protein ACXWT1_05815 [Methylobacter sp.]
MTDVVVVEVGGPEQVVVEVGVQGPPGLSAYQSAVANGFDGTEAEWLASLVGTSSGQYQHTQSTPAAIWTVNHNLGYRPTVQITTLGGRLIWGETLHTSINQVVIYLDIPSAGLAICS